ncbi:3-oxoacyl-ACP synthase [Amycolatopsis sp. WAC 04182]|uniref:beta-ketoacyl-ACP synthase 3 n=1 Tax=Amycolatopsis sp. WAC 04182 TaxID=2203198 RepID=UPI000F7876F7|nr:beta-ketoacyl-ACP synthase 3 [Amycolatopsis sp. WAC 04182]RSN55082.1 3-oxoacyl-ACP synthase [Amycolatopsis sp. WAC 04182]
MTARGARLLGVGAYRPKREVGNVEVGEAIGVEPGWIEARSGFASRRFASSDETVEAMAVVAATDALIKAQLAATDIDVVIMATFTYLWQMPAAAPVIAHRLGTKGGAFDLNAACAGFCYALAAARDFIRSGSARHVLVVAAERMTDVVDSHDKNTAFLFADGAGAAVVGPSEGADVGPVVWGCDGAQASVLTMTTSWADFAADPTAEQPYVRMDGQRLAQWIRREVVPAARRALDAAGVGWSDLRAFIPHQANARVVGILADVLGVPPEVVVAKDGVRSGNTSAASIPLAMHALLDQEQVASGDRALLIGFGAGASYAAQVVTLP